MQLDHILILTLGCLWFEHKQNNNDGVHDNPPAVPQRNQPPADRQFSAAQLSQLQDPVNEAVSSQCSARFSWLIPQSKFLHSPLQVSYVSFHPHEQQHGVEPFSKQSPCLQIKNGSSAQQQLEPSPSLARQSMSLCFKEETLPHCASCHNYGHCTLDL